MTAENIAGEKQFPDNTGARIEHHETVTSSVPHDHDELEEQGRGFGLVNSLIFMGLVFGFFSNNLVVGCLSAVLGSINNDLGPEADYTWIVSSIYVASSILSPFLGRLGDIFGRKYLLVLGNVLGLIGNVISANGHAISHLILGSVFIGLGNGMTLIAWVCVGELVRKKHRPMALAIFELFLTPSVLLGTFIGIELTQNTANSWRNIYWVCFGLHGAAIPILAFLYRPINQSLPEEGKTKWDQVKELDFVGLILFAIGLCLFLLGLSFGGTTFPWVSTGTLAPLLIGFLFLAFTGVWELKTSNPYNIFPHSVMRNYRGFTVVTGVAFLSGILYYSSLILWPLQISTLYASSTTSIGLYSMTWGFAAFPGAFVTGYLLQKVDQARYILTGICLIMTVAGGSQAIVGLHTNIASCALLALVGAVTSGAIVVVNSVIQLSVPHAYIGVAMGLVTTFRQVGGSIGSTVYQTILANYLTKHLGVNIATALAEAGLPSADIPAVAAALAGGKHASPALASAGPEVVAAGTLALKLTYVGAFKVVYFVSIGFGVAGTVCALFSRNIGEYLTNDVDVVLEKVGASRSTQNKDLEDKLAV